MRPANVNIDLPFKMQATKLDYAPVLQTQKDRDPPNNINNGGIINGSGGMRPCGDDDSYNWKFPVVKFKNENKNLNLNKRQVVPNPTMKPQLVTDRSVNNHNNEID